MEKKNENNLCSSTVLCYRIYNNIYYNIVLLRYDMRRTASEFEIGEQYNIIEPWTAFKLERKSWTYIILQ